MMMRKFHLLLCAVLLLSTISSLAQRAENCPSCYGTRKCQTCYGKGFDTYTTGSGPHTRQCGACGGNGRCTYCNGSGLNPYQSYDQPAQPQVRPTTEVHRHGFYNKFGIYEQFITTDYNNWVQKRAENLFDLNCIITLNEYTTYNEDDNFWYVTTKDNPLLVAIPKRQDANLFYRGIDEDEWTLGDYNSQYHEGIVAYQFYENDIIEGYRKLFYGPLWEKRVNHKPSAIYQEVGNDEENWYIEGEGVRITLKKTNSFYGKIYEFESKMPKNLKPILEKEDKTSLEENTKSKKANNQVSLKPQKEVKSDTDDDDEDLPWYAWFIIVPLGLVGLSILASFFDD